MRDALVAWLADRLGWTDATATVDRIGTGHSRAMYVVTPLSGAPVVVRMEQGGVFGTSGVDECRVMRALLAAGLPVARILAEERSGQVTGAPFFVMEHLDGARGSDERMVDAATAATFVDELHRLHGFDPAGLAPDGDVAAVFDFVPDHPSGATPLQVERWRRVYRAATDEPIPLLEEAAAWLVHHAPPLERLSVVHGDAGPGNFVHRDGRLVAMTDWEFAHLGDPAEDWAFCLTMRGARTMDREAWLELFHRRAGVELTDGQWAYWEAFNLFKGACANRTCLTLFENGANRMPNMAIIGTALHQLFMRRLVALVHA